MTLDEIDLTDNLLWDDEFSFNQMAEEKERGLTGGLIIQSGVKLYGRPVTLSGWLPRGTLDALITKEGAGNAAMALTLDDGREFYVAFDRTRGVAVDATPIKGSTHISLEPGAWYVATLRLHTVEPPQ
ncbi:MULTISPECIES: hypothetical protein [Gammaproteobacteria]|uniref:hypothetical protein n=1 Tax=Gammaproteobacteria TaxID=1236 RepID=UPI000792F31D|nr:MULTISPECIES: hypothetical protein [Gammaproteobacteria]KXJ42158.1 MAG: hypothetical protein AXW11_19565 [Marinobacter sp. Hex_13]SEF43969.1 hypothetical protein SAMN04515663_101374 [Alcanivorax sp. DSM 26293]